jgi:hypothetical protein
VINEVTFTPTEAMLKAVYDLHYKGISKKRLIGFVIFGMVLGFTTVLIEGFTSLFQSLTIMGVVLLWTFFVLIMTLAIVRYWWIPRFVRRIFAQQKDLQETATILWNETSYETEIASGKITTLWTEFYQWQRGESCLLLYRSEAMFNFFPTHEAAFVDAADTIQKHLVAAGVKEKT